MPSPARRAPGAYGFGWVAKARRTFRKYQARSSQSGPPRFREKSYRLEVLVRGRERQAADGGGVEASELKRVAREVEAQAAGESVAARAAEEMDGGAAARAFGGRFAGRDDLDLVDDVDVEVPDREARGRIGHAAAVEEVVLARGRCRPGSRRPGRRAGLRRRRPGPWPGCRAGRGAGAARSSSVARRDGCRSGRRRRRRREGGSRRSRPPRSRTARGRLRARSSARPSGRCRGG